MLIIFISVQNMILKNALNLWHMTVICIERNSFAKYLILLLVGMNTL